jgi:hypothetical protein
MAPSETSNPWLPIAALIAAVASLGGAAALNVKAVLRRR